MPSDPQAGLVQGQLRWGHFEPRIGTHSLQIACLLLKTLENPRHPYRPLGQPTETPDESSVWTGSTYGQVLLSKRARIETIRQWQREIRDSL